MHKWNLKFFGAKNEDPDTFLTRIENGRTMMYIYDRELLTLLYFFLSGVAVKWFEGHKRHWNTYEEFAEVCRERFSDPDFQFELIQET